MAGGGSISRLDVQPGGQFDDVREVVTARGLHTLEHILHIAFAQITHLIR